MKNLLFIFLFSICFCSTNAFAVIPGTVTSLTCTVISSSSISATWVTGTGTSTYYYARIDTSPTYTGDHSGSVIVYAPTVTTTFTGLACGTAYYVHVAALDGAWAWSGSINSSGCTTTGGSSLTVPFTEGFESGYTDATTLVCPVSQESVSGAATWMANSTATSYNRSARSGSFNATLYYSNDDWMFFPITFTSGVTYLFSMYARQDYASTTYSNITVKYGSSGTAAAMTSTIVASTGITNGSYQNLTGTFTPGSSGVLYVGIKGYMDGTPYYISVDDISITQMVSTSTDYFRSLATGNWQTAGTWQSSPDNVNWMTSTLVPTSAATSVNVQTGHTVTVNGTSTSGPLTITGTGNLTLSANLTVTGTVTGASTSTIAVGTSTLTVSGTTTISGTLSISTGTVDANGTFNATSGSVTFTGAGNLYLGGAVTSLGTFTESTSTVTYDYAGAQTVDSDTYYHFVTSGSGAKTLAGAIIVSGNITLSGGSLTQGTYNINVAGNWTSTGNYYTEGTGIVTFDGTGASSVSGTSSTYTSGITTINSNTFESSTGWTLTGGSGNWNLITPTGTNSPAADNSAVGTQCLKTCAASTAYSDNSNYILTSPTISLSGYTGTSLSFYMWMDAESSTTLYDGGLIEVYNGSSWSSISGSVAYDGTISDGTYSGSSGWTYDRLTWTLVTVDISAYDGNASFKIRYKFSSDVSGTGGGWAIDDFAVTGYVATAYTGEVFSKFATNKTGAGYVQLSSNVMAGTSFTLTSGLVKTGAYTLSLGNPTTNATVTGGSSTAYIVAYDNSGTIGSVKHFVNSAAGAVYTYPIGDATNYTPFTFTLTTATLSNAYLTLYTKATKITGLSTSITTNYIARHWNMTESGFTSPTYTISYNYVDGDIVGSETGMLPVKKSGSTWYKPTGSSFTNGTVQGTGSFTAGSNLLSWSGLTTFSLVGGVVNGAVALPIKLISYKGNKLGQDNELYWTTSTELNNDYFTIEKTYDGITFEIVSTQNGAGNSTQNTDYFLTDYNVRPVINYYRLKQTDFDGQSTVSEVIAIDNTTVETSKEVVMKTNILGQEVTDQYRGLVVIVYADGTSIKVIQ